MIAALEARGLLSIVRSSAGLIGYRFTGELYEAFSLVDGLLVKVLSAGSTEHSCPTFIGRDALEAIQFFDKLPTLPFRAVPETEDSGSDLGVAEHPVLNPSTCYHTFDLLRGSTWPTAALRRYTARAACHRFEPDADDPTRLGSFTMREFVQIGSPAAVASSCENTFQRAVKLLRSLTRTDVLTETATDAFYGDHASVLRRVQYATAAKCEVRLPWPTKGSISVGSRNLHADLFAKAFVLRSATGEPLHSGCVGFGIERLTLALLSGTPHQDPAVLVDTLMESHGAADE